MLRTKRDLLVQSASAERHAEDASVALANCNPDKQSCECGRDLSQAMPGIRVDAEMRCTVRTTSSEQAGKRTGRTECLH